MAGGQFAVSWQRRCHPKQIACVECVEAVAAGEAPSKRASGKSAAKAKPASEEPPPAERIDMVVDAKTAASITQRIKKRAASADKGTQKTVECVDEGTLVRTQQHAVGVVL